MKKLWIGILRWFNLDKIATLDELAKYTYKDPKKLANWLRHHIYYKTDKKSTDEWEPAEIAFKRLSCDCEELASIVYEVLLKWGWTPHIVVVWNGKRAHAVCAFHYGKWSYVDFAGLTVTNAMSLGTVPEYVYADWTGWSENDSGGEPVYGIKRG